MIEKIKLKIKKFIKNFFTKENLVFQIVFGLGFLFIEIHYPNWNLFYLSLLTFGSFILFTFSGLYILADIQYHRKTYYAIFLKRYSHNWWENLISPYHFIVMLIIKFRKLFK